MSGGGVERARCSASERSSTRAPGASDAYVDSDDLDAFVGWGGAGAGVSVATGSAHPSDSINDPIAVPTSYT